MTTVHHHATPRHATPVQSSGGVLVTVTLAVALRPHLLPRFAPSAAVNSGVRLMKCEGQLLKVGRQVTHFVRNIILIKAREKI